MLLELLAVGGIFFWGNLFALALLIGWIQDEHATGAMFIAAAAIAGLFLFTDLYKYVTLVGVLYTVVSYAAIGAVYSLVRWIVYIYDKIRKAKEDHARFGSTKPIEDFAKDYRPVALQNKERLIGWMVLWPLPWSGISFHGHADSSVGSMNT